MIGIRINRTIYKKYNDTKRSAGRKREYGNKYSLNKLEALPKTDLIDRFNEVTKSGAMQKIKLSPDFMEF